MAHKVTHLYNVVVKKQPEIMTFYNCNVVSPVWPAEVKNNSRSKRSNGIMTRIHEPAMLTFAYLSPTRSNAAVTKTFDFT